ncbi:MAG: hypothetical protein ABSH41_12465 [Syntrophobacteraceae bacterium]|jgi:hypothetical protein
MKINRLVAQLIIVVAMSICLGLLSQSLAFAVGPCQGDIEKYCSVAKGPRQELQCLKQNKEWLSPQCKLHVVKALKAAKDAR